MITDEQNTTTAAVFDRKYKISCPPERTAELQESANYLDNKMREISTSSKIVSMDNLAVVTALNITHELLVEQKQRHTYITNLNRRIKALEQKISSALDS